MPDPIPADSHSDGRLVGALVGLAMAAIGFGAVFLKCWVHTRHLNNVYGLQFGTETWHIAALSVGLLVGALGTVLFLKASFGRWTWEKR